MNKITTDFSAAPFCSSWMSPGIFPPDHYGFGFEFDPIMAMAHGHQVVPQGQHDYVSETQPFHWTQANLCIGDHREMTSASCPDWQAPVLHSSQREPVPATFNKATRSGSGNGINALLQEQKPHFFHNVRDDQFGAESVGVSAPGSGKGNNKNSRSGEATNGFDFTFSRLIGK